MGSVHAQDQYAPMASGSHHEGGMAHDMSDPAMGASTEADIRRRFWLALVLSIAVVALSPMATMLGIHFSISPSVRSWTLLVLTTPVVFWCGWMFISGAVQALRSRKLNMLVLIAVGVLAAYLASFYLTIIGSRNLFYEAAAMLVTFVLFGHWMAMKSRQGTSNALRALFDLVTAKARRSATHGSKRWQFGSTRNADARKLDSRRYCLNLKITQLYNALLETHLC